MKKLCLFVVILGVSGNVLADLGLNYPVTSDSVNEHNAKVGASSLGITTIYDHTNQAPQGQFYVPITYNRVGDPAAGEQDVNSAANTTDIDYVPLAQLKGATGQAGASGAQGSAGSQGSQGVQGTKGDKGDKGKDGRNGDDGDNRLTLNIGATVRWYDWKHVNITSGYRYDINHYCHTVDMVMVNIKLGKSYEQRETAALEKRLALLERMIKGDK